MSTSVIPRAEQTGSQSPEVTHLPEVKVTGEQLQEESSVGPYQQPEWTTARRFATTRVYVQQPPWGFGIEQWWKGQWNRGEGSNHLFQEEVEMGLPHRLQIDVYENWAINTGGTIYHDDVAAEVRWALADWGKIFLNPTLYGEWKFVENDRGPDKYEIKLLLGEELAPRWHWGFNAIYEQEVGGSRQTEWAVSTGFSYTIIDQKLSAGIEVKLETVNEQGARSDRPIECDIGPSIQWRPTPHSHLDIVPLFGVTGQSPHVEAWVVFGIDFGAGNERGVAPKSLQSQ